MATKVTLPLLGQTMEEGTIIQWFKKEGDAVKKEEPLLEVMTDKANMEVESPAEGTLLKIIAGPDATIPVKALIGIIGDPGEDISDIVAEAGADAPSNTPKAEEESGSKSNGGTPTTSDTPAVSAFPPSGGKIAASPRARKLAEEHGIDIASVGQGSGPGGRIIEKDVLRAIESGVGAVSQIAATPLAGKVAADLGVSLEDISGTGPGGKIQRADVEASVRASAPALTPRINLGQTIPFAGLRKAVADNLVKSWNSVVPVTLSLGVDMTEAVKLREQLKPVYEQKYGVKLSFTDIVIKAAAKAVEDFPFVNSTLEDNQIKIHDSVNVCVAISVPDGLIAPPVMDANLKPMWAISAEIREMADKARSGRLSEIQLSGGTFTVTNLGAFGIEHFTPIINPPQSAILAVCAIKDEAVVEAGQVVVKPMMNIQLTFDHRVMDGAPAAQYIARVKEMLEQPYLMLG